MNPRIGLHFEDSKLRSAVEKTIQSLELIPINLKSVQESHHLCISDSIPSVLTAPLVLIRKQPPEEMQSFVNSGKDLVWFSKMPDLDVLTDVIKNALEDSIWNQQSILLSKEINSKNKQLELMNSDLESIVNQRTSSVADEKKEAEGRQKKIRKLVEFVQKLSESETIFDYVECIRHEFRSNYAISDVFLMPVEKDKVLKDIRIHLANKLSRPIGPILQLQLYTKFANLPTHSCLIVEHGMDDLTVNEFVLFATERLQMMGLALERIFLFEELNRSSIEWESTFDTLADPVGIVDIDYRLLRSNSTFGTASFKSQCHKVLMESDSICDGCPVAAASRSGKLEIGQIRKGNRFFRVHSYPIRMSHDTTVTTVVNHYVDVTEDRILYSRVVQHEKMMALGIMAGHIAHELNNPLTGIRSLCQVLGVDEKIADNIKKDLREIENASERCQIIIKNLLEFTLQRDEKEIHKVSLNDVVNKTLPMLKTAMRFHSTNIELTTDETPVLANAHLLQQVVFNLVNNSCQAMPQAGEVTIETRREKGKMYLRVGDTGPGIPDENIPRLFEAFFTTKPLGEGTGLGLSMSRAIVEKFGGKITLVKTGSTGTVFEINFDEAKP
jgi:two-component system, NtrC family, sensor kinase